MSRWINIVIGSTKIVIVLIFLILFVKTGFTQEIHEAVKNGDLKKVKMLLEKNPALLNSQDNFGSTPLHWAGIRSQEEIFIFLIKKGADVTITESHGGTPLHWASAWDNADLVEKLISKGAEVNKGNRNRGTALHYAARRGCYNVVKLLIEKGADVNIQKTSDKTTPLHLAGENGHDRVYDLLVENGADENLLNKAGKSPLQLKNEFIRRKVIKIDPAIYDSYVGKYYSEGGSILEIVKSKDRIFLKFALFQEEIFPESETKFFSKTENRQVVFIKDDDNRVKEILYTSERRTTKRKKLVVEKSY